MATAKKSSPAKAAPDPESEALAALPSKLRKLVIKNFRSIGKNEVAVDLDDVVVLVGPNNVGKSTVLYAYEKIMSESAPKLTLDDCPNKRFEAGNPPEVQLHTSVGENPPASRWIDNSSGENIVKERWLWSGVDVAAQVQGWDVNKKEWANQRPWGAANVANARRPEPHRIEAFASPETQAKQVIDLLLKALKDQLKKAPAEKTTPEGATEKTTYGKLLATLADIQKEVLETSRQQIETAEKKLTEFIGGVFQGYTVKFDAKPEESLAAYSGHSDQRFGGIPTTRPDHSDQSERSDAELGVSLA